jgi:hypothetical protein
VGLEVSSYLFEHQDVEVRRLLVLGSSDHPDMCISMNVLDDECYFRAPLSMEVAVVARLCDIYFSVFHLHEIQHNQVDRKAYSTSQRL